MNYPTAIGVFTLFTGLILGVMASRSGVRKRIPMLDFVCLMSGVICVFAMYFSLHTMVASIFVGQLALGLIITRLRWVWLKEKNLPVTVNTLFGSTLKP
jgi:hypothetical protein